MGWPLRVTQVRQRRLTAAEEVGCGVDL